VNGFIFQIFIDPIQVTNAVSHILLASHHRAILHPLLSFRRTVFLIRSVRASTGLDLLRSSVMLWHCPHGFLA